MEATPFVDPGYFDHDLQFFAPVEVEEFGGNPPPRTGWYFEYSRLYLSTSTPELGVNSNWQSYSWGNRFEIGYFTADQTGWMFEYTRFAGPSSSTSFINNPDQVYIPDPNADPDVFDPNPTAGTPTVALDVRSIENIGDLHRFDMAKAFRLDQFDNGGTVEMYIGGGYFGFTDKSYRATDVQILDPITGVPTGEFFPNQPLTVPVTNNRIWNMMVGIRGRKQKGRWVLTGEARGLAGINFQHFAPYTTVTAAFGNATSVLVARDYFAGSTSDEFVVGGDLRGEAEFQFTRDIAFQVGFSMTYLGTGVARYGVPSANNEDLMMVGANFGFLVNR
ncbi:hypothetical protein [Lignipirellula cremea]|nr:hypothetical protein [Lignipirellula cremea]